MRHHDTWLIAAIGEQTWPGLEVYSACLTPDQSNIDCRAMREIDDRVRQLSSVVTSLEVRPIPSGRR